MTQNKIITALDNLTQDQTEVLLEKNIEMKISSINRYCINNAVWKKIGVKKQRMTFGLYIPKKLIACIVAFAIALVSIPVVGFDSVSAAIGKIFNFAPGVGITEKNNDTLYVFNPIVRQTPLNTLKATIVNARYINNYLLLTVMIDGEPFYDIRLGKVFSYDDLTSNDLNLYINGSLTSYDEDASAQLLRDTRSILFNFSCGIAAPKDSDIYEIEITGFPKRLSFALLPCQDYADIAEIGPSDIQNGIPVLAFSDRVGGQLFVWCYSFNATTDTILRYGYPQHGFYSNSYIATERSIITANESFLVSSCLVFAMPENYQTATLHIPYLSMSRSENYEVSIKLPKGYSATECNISIKCSLGTIRITEVKRTQSENPFHDRIDLKIVLDSNDDNIVFDAFDYHMKDGGAISSLSLSTEGRTEGMSIWMENDVDWISFTISTLYYRLLGEYVIPLDIQ